MNLYIIFILGKWWGDRNKIPVLAIHGWQDNSSSFDKLIPQLSLPAILAIDLPGHAKSSHLPKGKTYNFLETVILVHKIVSHYQWAKVPILTHSLGGLIGFGYASLFPDKVKWFINIECGRTLLVLHRFNLPLSYSKAWNTLLKIEEANRTPTVYKLSEMIQLVVEGSFGSIYCPEAAMTILQRGIYLAGESSGSKKKKENSQMQTTLHDFVEFEIKIAELMPPKEQKELKKFHMQKMELLTKAKENLKNFKLDEEKDKYYCFSRDSVTKVHAFQSVGRDFIMKASTLIKCPVLSIRADNGLLFGSTRKLYENSLEAMKASSSYFEHHEVEGTHHVHLTTPENVAPIVNNFVQKFTEN